MSEQSRAPVVTVSTNVDEFNRTLEKYSKVVRIGAAGAVAKKASQFGYTLGTLLKELTPAKGQVRAERLAALKVGGGIHIRRAALDYARRKTVATASNLKTRKGALFMEANRAGKVKRNALTFTELAVKRELSIRESGRGYTPYSARFTGFSTQLREDQYGTKTKVTVDRVSRGISRAAFSNSEEGASMTYQWGNGNPATNALARALQKPAQQSRIARALAAVNADMVEYIQRKTAEAAAQAAA